MKKLPLPLLLMLASLSGLFLAGCSGFNGVHLPEITTASAPGALRGSVYGGHAPIAFANIYLLEVDPAAAAYGAKVKSLLTTASTATSGTFPVTQDASGDATNGFYHVISDGTGSFNISGDYTCDAGYPVYLYAAGGSPGALPAVSITTAVSSGSSSPFTLTFTASNLLYAGQSVLLSGLSGDYASLNGSTQLVDSASTTAFNVLDSAASAPSGTSSGTAQPLSPNNPGIVNLAVLGNCPSVGAQNFSSINFVYMNEISTVAAAYALGGFADTTIANDALHIGFPAGHSLALAGIQSAAINAGQLYDIQGGNLSTTYNGEGHIARAYTPGNGTNGVVPQALLDTLGNILAACVDSNNTNSSPGNPNLGTTGPATSSSTQCDVPFSTATADGTSSGPQPVDIATAIINISHHPGGVADPTFVYSLYTLPPSNVPFAPYLISQPKDFTVGITFQNETTGSPFDIAIDQSGNSWITNRFGGCSQALIEVTPQGVLASNPNTVPGCLAASTSNGQYNEAFPVASAIDPAGNVFTTSRVSSYAAGQGQLYKLDNNANSAPGSPSLLGTLNMPTGIASDGNFIYIADTANDEVVAADGNGNEVGAGNAATFPCLAGASYVALDGMAGGWVDSVVNNTVCKFSLLNYNVQLLFTASTGLSAPHNIAIDSGGNAWVANLNNNSISRIALDGALTSFVGGGLNNPSGIVVDSSGFVWVANRGASGSASSLSEFAATAPGFTVGTAISGSSGFSSTGGSSNLAIDFSGNIWVPQTTNNLLTEFIGLSTPAITPLSAAVVAGSVSGKP